MSRGVEEVVDRVGRGDWRVVSGQPSALDEGLHIALCSRSQSGTDACGRRAFHEHRLNIALKSHRNSQSLENCLS